VQLEGRLTLHTGSNTQLVRGKMQILWKMWKQMAIWIDNTMSEKQNYKQHTLPHIKINRNKTCPTRYIVTVNLSCSQYRHHHILDTIFNMPEHDLPSHPKTDNKQQTITILPWKKLSCSVDGTHREKPIYKADG
jgi:hypothetical protein